MPCTISCTIYLILTFIIPLRQTYDSLKNPQKNQNQVWAIYWALYTLINFVVWLLPFLEYQPFQSIILLFLIWLYYDKYRGAIQVDNFLRGSMEKNETFKQYLNLVIEKTKILGYFEDKQVQKPKDQ